MMENTPLVSVIMPAYNAERFIRQAIQSVVNQTMPDWELLVLDDASKDETCAIVKEFENRDARIRLIEGKENAGPARLRNLGIEMSKGIYIALLDSDDVWFPDKLKKQVEYVEATKADIIYCSYAMINEKDEKQCSDFVVSESATFESMLVQSVISCSTALLKKQSIQEYRFPEKYYHEDYVFWLRLLKHGCVAKGLQEVLAAYRLLSDSRASNKIASAVRRWHVYRKYLKMSFFKSFRCFVQYALYGVKKYRTE